MSLESSVNSRVHYTVYRKKTLYSKLLELVMSDICHAEEESFDGYKYFITFLHTYTSFFVVYPVVNKSENLDRFKEFKVLAATRFTFRIINFESDNGAEYLFFRQKKY